MNLLRIMSTKSVSPASADLQPDKGSHAPRLEGFRVATDFNGDADAAPAATASAELTAAPAIDAAAELTAAPAAPAIDAAAAEKMAGEKFRQTCFFSWKDLEDRKKSREIYEEKKRQERLAEPLALPTLPLDEVIAIQVQADVNQELERQRQRERQRERQRQRRRQRQLQSQLLSPQQFELQRERKLQSQLKNHQMKRKRQRQLQYQRQLLKESQPGFDDSKELDYGSFKRMKLQL
jgi:hypothetical protein